MLTHTCNENCWVVCHNNDDIWHLSEGSTGVTVNTGQPYLDTFSSKEEALSFIPEEHRPSNIN